MNDQGWVLSLVTWAVPGSAACVRWPGARLARRGGFAREDFFFQATERRARVGTDRASSGAGPATRAAREDAGTQTAADEPAEGPSASPTPTGQSLGGVRVCGGLTVCLEVACARGVVRVFW